jgi:hypothetical protein
MDEITIGQMIATKKPHTCGNSDWAVFQVADRIGIRCVHCGQRVFVPSHKFADYIDLPQDF